MIINARAMSLSNDGKRFLPTPYQWHILEAMARHPGWVYTRAQLLRAAGAEASDERSIDVQIKRIRAAVSVCRVDHVAGQHLPRNQRPQRGRRVVSAGRAPLGGINAPKAQAVPLMAQRVAIHGKRADQAEGEGAAHGWGSSCSALAISSSGTNGAVPRT